MQALSGLATGATSLPNTVANLPIRGLNGLFGTKIPQFKTSNPLGIAPATSDIGQDVEGMGESLGSLAPMMIGGAGLEAAAPVGSMAAKIGSLIKDVPPEAVAPVGAAGAIQKQVENTPEIPPKYRQIAGMGAGLLGAGTVAGLTGLGEQAASSVGDIASAGLGIGKKQSFTEGLPEDESISVTKGQAQYATSKVRAAGGTKLAQDLNKDPLQAAHSAISDKLDGVTPLEAGETPDDLKAQQAAIQTSMAARGSQFERVPGERPTTAQVSPSTGMQTLEKTARLNPKGNYGAQSFQAADQAKNAAFVQHLENMNPGITSKLGDAFVEKATDVAGQQQQIAQSGQKAMQGVTSPLSANVEPAATGAAIRGAGEDAYTARRASTTNDLWSQVPKDMVHSIAPAQDMAHVLTGNRAISIPNDAPPELQNMAQRVSQFVINPAVEDVHPGEAAMYQKIAALPPNIPYRDTATLLSGLSATKSQLSQQGLSGSRPMARLSMLEGSLQDSMAGDFANKLTAGEIPLVPPGSQEGQQALNAARQQSAVDKQDFTRTNSSVGQVLAKGAYGDYKIHNLADVASNVISGNASEPERVGEWLNVLKNDPQGTQALQDGLVSDANRRGVIKPDGTVDLTKYPRWMSPSRQSTVAQFPGLTEKFKNAAAMQQMVDDANGQAKQAVTNYGNGIAKKFLGGQDPGVAVRSALNAGDRGQTLSQIHAAVASNVPAEEALKGYVIKEIINKFAPEGGAAAGQDNAMIAAKSFRKFVQEYTPGLRKIFGGQGMQNFDFVRAGLQQAQDAQVALKGQSQTTPLGLLAKANNMTGGHGTQGIGVGVAGLLGEHAAEMAGTHGLIGAAGAMGATMLVGAMKSAAVHNTQDLVGAMMRYPEFAKIMLQKLPPRATLTQNLTKRMGDALRATAAPPTVPAPQQDQRPPS
jgi:hypothetical protein